MKIGEKIDRDTREKRKVKIMSCLDEWIWKKWNKKNSASRVEKNEDSVDRNICLLP